MRRWAPALSVALLGVAAIAAADCSSAPLPSPWPTDRVHLGMSDPPGGAAAMRATAPFGFRYQYLAGGVNTGNGWAHWNPDGAFVTGYIQDSIAHGMTPVFTYYQLYQSSPGNGSGEAEGLARNLGDAATMRAYYDDLRLFFQRAGAFREHVVLHIEPDLWGFMQQRARGDDAATVPVRVGSSGAADVEGLDNAWGFARAIVRLRNTYAPNVLLGYHVSIWGTGTDIGLQDPPDHQVDALAQRAARFYQSLQANFDITFGEFSDRDAAFKEHIYGDGGASWWNEADFARHRRFIAQFTSAVGKRMVLWQIPLGNTRMRAMDNSWNHYQDNRVEWLLEDPTRGRIAAYVRAGVVAFLFGRGADGATCACDANGDGVTNPAPISGNTRNSISADDDGGLFREKAAEYYRAGALPLGG
jgi:hypothetical protein